MKLFLTSSADKTLHLLKKVAPSVGTRVLFCANAADIYEGDHFWVDWDRNAFQKLGYHLTEVDLRNVSTEEFNQLLNENDILHMCGGSVSYLYWLLNERKISDSIIVAVKNDSVLYTGTSAGSMVVSENLAMFAYDEEEEREHKKHGFSKKKGLGLVPWTIVPHCNQPDFTASHKDVVDELVTNITPTIFLHDSEAVWVEGNKLEILKSE